MNLATRTRSVLATLAAALVVGGCGGEARLEAEAASAMHRRVDDARAAVAARDRERALAALDGLERRVRRELEAGGLAESHAAGLLERVASAKRRVRRELPAVASTPEPTATPLSTPEPQPEGDGDKEDEEKGKGETEGWGQLKDKDKDEEKGKEGKE